MTKSDTISPLTSQSRSLVEKGQKYFLPNYKPREMILDHGKGARIWDADGNEFIDLGSGIAVCSLGHSDPDLVKALTDQANKLWHTSNIFFTQPPVDLAEQLVEASDFAKRVYFCNSGTEANEAAIKLVRKYAANNGRTADKREIITFTGSFHGRTLAAVTATAQPKYQEGYEPLPGGFTYVAFNDFDAIEKAVSDKTCAIMVEPVQGEGGIVPAHPDFLAHLRKLCDKHDALLVLDEIQCGMERTGHFLAYMGYANAKPDIVTLAKALGCGIPIGAMLVGEKAEDTFQFGSHGSTFGGNPIMCNVALAALKKLRSPAVKQNVTQKSEKIFATLRALGDELGMFEEIRGVGLMIGAALKPQWHGKAGEITELCRQHGVLVLVAGPNVLRFLPPLNITDEELETGMDRVKTALKEYLAQ
ncbi:MAG: aspartate aminotransferase family protein [Alphaproteobacteria bacterium]|nr:aspartate aminotransferase family protein [Alphaproteobacteria bacterium]